MLRYHGSHAFFALHSSLIFYLDYMSNTGQQRGQASPSKAPAEEAFGNWSNTVHRKVSSADIRRKSIRIGQK